MDLFGKRVDISFCMKNGFFIRTPLWQGVKSMKACAVAVVADLPLASEPHAISGQRYVNFVMGVDVLLQRGRSMSRLTNFLVCMFDCDYDRNQMNEVGFLYGRFEKTRCLARQCIVGS